MGERGTGAVGRFGEEYDGATGLADAGEVESEAAGAIPRLVDGDGNGAVGEMGSQDRIGEMGGDGVHVEDAGTFAEKRGEAADEVDTGPGDGKNGREARRAGTGEKGNDFDRDTLCGGGGFETSCAGEEKKGVFGCGIEVTEVVEGAEGGTGNFVPGREGVKAGGGHEMSSKGWGRGWNAWTRRR